MTYARALAAALRIAREEDCEMFVVHDPTATDDFEQGDYHAASAEALDTFHAGLEPTAAVTPEGEVFEGSELLWVAWARARRLEN